MEPNDLLIISNSSFQNNQKVTSKIDYLELTTKNPRIHLLDL